MKAPAMARTSWGSKGMSKAWGMAVAPDVSTFRIVWWRASTVTMDAAAVRTVLSATSCAAPRYAPTPTSSTRRATGNMVGTSVSTLVKSNLQVERGVTPNEVRNDCNANRSQREKVGSGSLIRTSRAVTWVASSSWMAVNCSMGICAELKPAAVKSDAWNLDSACE